MKAGLTQMVFALQAIRDLQLACPLVPIVLINSDELGRWPADQAVRGLTALRPVQRTDFHITISLPIGFIECSGRESPLSAAMHQTLSPRVVVKVIRLLIPEKFVLDSDRVTRWLPATPLPIGWGALT